MCWGRGDGVSAERPVGGEPASFYALYEFQWESVGSSLENER